MVGSFNDSSNHTKCPDPWDDEGTRELLQKFCFWFGGIFFCTIGALGLIGNALSIIVYSSKELRSTFHVLLVVLSAFDIGYILMCVVNEGLEMPGYFSPDWPDSHSNVWIHLFPTFLYPLRQMFLTASMYTTVSICINRYLFIVHPFYMDQLRRHSTSFTSNQSASFEIDSNRIAGYIFGVVLFSIAYSIPHFFEYKISIDAEGNHEVVWTDLRKNEIYTLVFTIGIDFSFRVVLPVVVMLFTNLRIFMILHRQPDCGSKDKQFAITLFTLVTIFLLCQSGKIAINIQEFLTLSVISECQEIDNHLGETAWDIIMSRVARVLLLLNSSINFVVYMASSKQFRRKVCRLRCRRPLESAQIANPFFFIDDADCTWDIIFGQKKSTHAMCHM